MKKDWNSHIGAKNPIDVTQAFLPPENPFSSPCQTKSTNEKDAVMCDFRWGENPGQGLSFAVGCCGALFLWFSRRKFVVQFAQSGI
jgi:hypothetical protein